MVSPYLTIISLSWRYRHYEPQRITPTLVRTWLNQFDEKDHKAMLRLLGKVEILSNHAIKQALIQKNEALLKHLESSNIPNNKVIYVQTDEAGSSSGVMLNMLRDASRLVQRRCPIVHSFNGIEINKLTSKIQNGAIVYVDDFAGSGRQLKTNREKVEPFIVGNFSEFFLVPVVCEEAMAELS